LFLSSRCFKENDEDTDKDGYSFGKNARGKVRYDEKTSHNRIIVVIFIIIDGE
jgi:hypothetical protein